jgi:hypothetical protein
VRFAAVVPLLVLSLRQLTLYVPWTLLLSLLAVLLIITLFPAVSQHAFWFSRRIADTSALPISSLLISNTRSSSDPRANPLPPSRRAAHTNYLLHPCPWMRSITVRIVPPRSSYIITENPFTIRTVAHLHTSSPAYPPRALAATDSYHSAGALRRTNA